MIASDAAEILVFDTGPLSHFAKQSWLGVLRAVLGQRTAVIRDTVVSELKNGVHAAKVHNLRYQGTLALLCEGIRSELLTVALVSTLADHLLESEYRLPFGPGGFEKWARQQGMV